MIWLRAPVDGYAGLTASDQLAYVDGGTDNCWYYYGSIADNPFGAFGSNSMTVNGADCRGQITFVAAFEPATVTTDTDSGQTPTNGHVPWPTSSDPGTNGEATTTTRDRIRGELENNPGAYPTLRPWLDAHLGGDSTDPTGQLIKIPACTGDTNTACRTRLQDAGFTGTITRRTLSSDDAVMEQQADRVTTTSPAAGSQAEYDADITIYVNPDPMPTMTAQQTLIAEALQSNNPEQVNETNKKTLARQCERYATVSGSGRTATDCMSPALPIYVIGREWPQAADHTIRGLAYNPAWVLLTYKDVVRTTGTTAIPRRMAGQPAAAAPAAPRPATSGRGRPPNKAASQAFRFRISRSSTGGRTASAERGTGGFVSTCKLAERKTLPTPLNGGGNFLVIPVSKGAPSTTPSLSLCHGTNP